MSCRVLSEAQSAPAGPFCLGKSSEPGQTGCDLRLCVEGHFEALDMERSGGVSGRIRQVKPIFKRSRRWVKADTADHMVKALNTDSNLE